MELIENNYPTQPILARLDLLDTSEQGKLQTYYQGNLPNEYLEPVTLGLGPGRHWGVIQKPDEDGWGVLSECPCCGDPVHNEADTQVEAYYKLSVLLLGTVEQLEDDLYRTKQQLVQAERRLSKKRKKRK